MHLLLKDEGIVNVAITLTFLCANKDCVNVQYIEVSFTESISQQSGLFSITRNDSHYFDKLFGYY